MWALPPEDRVLLVAAYWRTSLTRCQPAPLFGVSKSAADRVVDHLDPLLGPQPRKRFRKGAALVVDGTLLSTRDPAVKNYRYSTNHQVVDARLVVAVGRPVTGNRNGCKAWGPSGAEAADGTVRVTGDGGCHGTGVFVPTAANAAETNSPTGDTNTTPTTATSARIEHASPA